MKDTNIINKRLFYLYIFIFGFGGLFFINSVSMKFKVIGICCFAGMLIVIFKNFIRRIIKIRFNKKITQWVVLVTTFSLLLISIYTEIFLIEFTVSYILPILIATWYVLIKE